MKPFRIFIFFLLTGGLLLALSTVFPEEGISLGGDAKLRFVTSANLFSADTSASPYTDSLIKNAVVMEDPEWDAPGLTSIGANASSVAGNSSGIGASSDLDGYADRSIWADKDTSAITDGSIAMDASAIPEAFTGKDISADSDSISLVRTAPVVNQDSLVRARIDSISGRVFPIEATRRAALQLNRFFKTAEQAGEKGELLRILHYGDSQIENDRMTSLLRYRFQKVFGGSGCGMVPAIPLYSGNPAFRQNYEGEWTRYTGFGKRDTTLGHASYGMMACFTSVPQAVEGSLPTLEFGFLSGRKAARFNALKIFLHSYADNGMITVHYNDTISDTLRTIGGGYTEITLKPGFTPKKVKLEFGLKEGGRIYGISFDPQAGVQVDNIAMRGSSGLEFSRFDSQLLDTMLTAVRPGMIIMQFGGNVVPYLKNSASYKRFFKRELRFLKQLAPEVPIVVIGPGDMSTKQNGKFITYETLVPVRNALREAALESDCAFWDMYEAMGGRNSIRNFVLADPPLATPDYIHFTPRGANLMAGMFFDAVMLEYERYRVNGMQP
jgi:lysophospholipase L1-like esterase